MLKPDLARIDGLPTHLIEKLEPLLNIEPQELGWVVQTVAYLQEWNDSRQIREETQTATLETLITQYPQEKPEYVTDHLLEENPPQWQSPATLLQTYPPGAIVTHNGTTWQNRTNHHTDTEPGTSNDWENINPPTEGTPKSEDETATEPGPTPGAGENTTNDGGESQE